MANVDAVTPLELADTIASLYEAAVTPAQWPTFLNRFARLLGGRCAAILLYDYARGAAGADDAALRFPVFTAGFDPDRQADFQRHYIKTNPWLPATRDIPAGQPVISSAVYPESELTQTEFYNDWLRPQGLRYALGSAACNCGSVSLRITTMREERLGPFEASALEAHRLLAPHMKRAFALHDQVKALRASAAHSHAALDRVTAPVWLVGEDRRLSYANEAGRALDALRDGLWIGPDGAIRAADPDAQRHIDRALSMALAVGRHGTGSQCCGDVPVGRRGGKSPLLVSIYPLGARSPFGDATAAAVFIAEPDAQPATRAHALCVQFGFTPAEARLAAALAAGASLAEHAEAHGVSKNTVRTHLQRVLRKCGARNQAGLVRLVSAVASSHTPPSAL